MQPKSTLKQVGISLKTIPIIFLLFCIFSGRLNAQQYVNRPLSTGATSSNGTPAPAGFTWSEVQLGNTNAGFTNDITNFTLADNFTIGCGIWNLTKLTFFAYSSNFAGGTSPYTDVRVAIYNTNPSVGNPAPIFGDRTTNRLLATSSAGMYRIFNATPGTTRHIWRIEATVVTTLSPGTYWIEWGLGNGGLANFSPSVTVVGTVTQAGNNALQRTVAGGTWAAALDGANAQDLPFIIDYTSAACTGTPAPGNTITSLTAACPGIPFNLSLQNCVPGSGVTYQWQSAPAAAGPWTDIAGATNATYSTTLTATTFYRNNVTCGGVTTASNPEDVLLTPPSSCYCSSGATSTADEDIFNVMVGTQSNASTCASVGTGPLSIQNRYSNYTSGAGAPAAFEAYRGIGNTIAVTIGTCGGNFTNSVAVWIDLNQDGQFTAAERLYVSPSGSAGPHTETGVMNIPATALLGLTRMRVVNVETGIPTGILPCGTYTWGETEDYNVNITTCVQGTFTTHPSAASTACSGNASFTVVGAGSALTFRWQQRINASAPWTDVTNGGIFSGATTATLTLTNIPGTMTGYQYRGLMSGPCTAIDFSNPATLTVTPLVATVNPTSATICNGGIQQLTLTNVAAPVDLINEGFNVASPLPAGWAAQNLSSPVGTSGWFQGDPLAFPAQSGATNAYIAANYLNTTGNNTISNWLFAPNISMKNGDILTFWTRTVSPASFPDRLEVRMSTNGASVNAGATNVSVGDFTTLLLTVNPTLTTTGYPTAWTQFTVTISGLAAPVSGRLAFRYFVTSGGPAGANSDYIGIDNVVYVSGGAAQGVWSGPAGTIFTDAAGTVPYVTGSLANTVYVKPTATSTYSVVYSTLTPCTSPPTNIVVNVSNPATGLAVTPLTRAVCVGANTSFSATTTGGGPFTWQWQSSPDGTTWTNITGATGATLNLSAVTLGMSGTRYRVIATAAPCAGSVTSTVVGQLTVNPLPTVTIAAGDATLIPGQSTTITATSNPTGATFVWTRDGVAIGGPNTNTRTATVDSIGTYQVTVTTAAGCVAVSNSIVIGTEASDRLWIYPNPSDGVFQVRLFYRIGNVINEKRVVSVYTAHGDLVARKEFALDNVTNPYLKMEFDLSRNAPGTYVVKVADRFSGQIVSGLLVIAR